MLPLPRHNEMAEQHFNALPHSLGPAAIHRGRLFATEVILPRFLLVMDVGSESIRVVENYSDKLGTMLFFQKLAAAILQGKSWRVANHINCWGPRLIIDLADASLI